MERRRGHDTPQSDILFARFVDLSKGSIEDLFAVFIEGIDFHG